MPRRQTKRAAPAYGVTLAEFRGTYKLCQRADWWIFWLLPSRRGGKGPTKRHAIFLAACTLVLPLDWHRDHAGRLSEAYYNARNEMLNVQRPLDRPTGAHWLPESAR